MINYDSLIAYIEGLNADGTLSNADYNKVILYILANGDLDNSPRDLMQFRRGNKTNLPTLAQGEPALCLDESKIYVGGESGNIGVASDRDITKLEKKVNKSYIFISDSYGESPDVANSWITYLKSYAHLTDGVNAFSSFLSGASFGGPIKLLTALENLSATITNKDEITDIIVGCGYNDIDYVGTIYAGMQAFSTYVATNYPNATVKVACISLTSVSGKQFSMMNAVVPAYKDSCQVTSKFNYIENSHLIFHRYDQLAVDGIHPNNFGSAQIARGLSGYIKTGSVMFTNTGFVTNNVLKSGINTNLNFDLMETMSGELVNLVSFGGILTCASTTFIDYQEIGTITAPTFIRGGTGSFCGFTLAVNVFSGTWFSAPASIVFRNGKVYIMVYSLSAITQIHIPQINVALATIYC